MTLWIKYNMLQTNKQKLPVFDFVHGGVHWWEGKLLGTLIYLILPVRRVDKSKQSGMKITR